MNDKEIIEEFKKIYRLRQTAKSVREGAQYAEKSSDVAKERAQARKLEDDANSLESELMTVLESVARNG